MSLVNLAKKPLPVSLAELPEGVNQVDFVYVSGDAYVDHPSFGTAIIGRILEKCGFTVGIIPQPDFKNSYKDGSGKGVCVFGRPRLGFLVTAGNIDSMVAQNKRSLRRRTHNHRRC